MSGSECAPPSGSARRWKDRHWSEYPIGTKAHAYNGGHWTKMPNGWKWFCGDTFATPGGDAIGACIELPNDKLSGGTPSAQMPCSACGRTGQDDPPPGKYHGLCLKCGGSGKQNTKGTMDNQMLTPCTWIEDADGNWRTGCKQLHIFIDGTPSENGYAYCPYCGAKIETVIYQEKP